MIRTCVILVISNLAVWPSVSMAHAQEYPEASVEQATHKTILGLKIDRLEGLDEAGLQVEYEWALSMARLCLDNLHVLKGRQGWHDYPMHFQQHAGRTARFRGYGEQAIADYETAIGYAYESARLVSQEEKTLDPEDWEKGTFWRDIADTYLMMGSYEAAEGITKLIIERDRLRGEASGCAPDLHRLAQIAEREGQLAQAVGLHGEAIQATQFYVEDFLNRHPELQYIDPGQSWGVIVRHSDVRAAMVDVDHDDASLTTALREVYYRLGRTLRLDAQLDQAEHALETAKRTPWSDSGSYRIRQNLDVDREWAFLYLAQGEAGEALAKAEYCLGQYVMSPAEEIELLDLVSRAKESLGDVGGAMEALEAAIGIVEGRRANLVSDQFKQSFISGYAPLYRRALDLVANYELGITNYERESPKVRKQGSRSRGVEDSSEGRRPTPDARSPEPESHPTDHESRTTNHQPRSKSNASRSTNNEGRPTEASAATAFQWAERLKGRAMLDAINRYDQRMARAVANSDTAEMARIRDLAGRVCSVSQIQKLLPPDTALIEYAFGGGKLRITNYELRSEEKTKSQDVEEEGLRSRGVEDSSETPRLRPDARGLTPKTHPADHKSRSTNHERRVYLWVVTKDGASFQRLDASAQELDERCSKLTERLPLGDDSWVDPAARLYELTIKPVVECLNGIRRLVVVGDGPLNTIPFEVLIASRDRHPDRALKHHLLIEDFSISYAPSGTLLAIIQEKQQTRSWDQSLWAFASTKFGAAMRDSSVAPEASVRSYKDILRSARSLELRDLPYTRREVEELNRYFRDSSHRTVIDEANMKGMLLAASTSGELGMVRFLHFATHAVHPTDRPYLSGLVLSPPFPVDTEKKNDDREEGTADQDRQTSAPSKLDSILKREKRAWRPELLTLGELSKLKLNSELVVLSACDTLGKDTVDGDWINGLARSFLMAGSSGVICTLWEAADRNTANVMPAIYQALVGEDGPDGMDVPRALQRFKCARLGFPKHAHPSTWAPYVYHGRIVSRP